MMDDNVIVVIPNADNQSLGVLRFRGRDYECTLGKGGVVPATEKKEGDGASPAGVWPLRCVYYRQDKVDKPQTALDIIQINAQDGWCDAPDHPDYNMYVTLPHEASCEELCRKDDVYDVIVPLGYNDDPPVAGKGSAIFMHVMRPEKTPTEGCVALTLQDLYAVLEKCDSQTRLSIQFQ